MEKDRSYEKVILFFQELGVSDANIKRTIAFFKEHYNTEENVYPKMISTTKMLLDYGFTKENIKSIATEFQALYAYNTEFLKDRLALFESRGYSKHQIIKMITRCGSVLRTSDEKIESRRLLLKELGFEGKDFITMTYKNPYIFVRGKEQLLSNLDYFESLGISREDGIKMFKRFPHIIGLDSNYINKKLELLVSVGFKRDVAISMIRICPSIFSYSEKTLKERLDTLKSLGFTHEEAIYIYSIGKVLFTTSSEDLILKMNCIKESGFTDEEAKKIVIEYPSILSLNVDSLREKLEYYNNIGLHNVIVRTPKNLIQGLALSKARYNYFRRNGLKIEESNHKRLFMGEKQFIKQFNKTKEELIEEDTGSSVIISHANIDSKGYEKVFVRK